MEKFKSSSMRNKLRYYKGVFFALFVLSIGLNACQKYLDQTPDVLVTDQDVFGDYRSFQGFVDQCYQMVQDYYQVDLATSYNMGGLFASVQNYTTAKRIELGDYRGIVGEGSDIHSVFKTTTGGDDFVGSGHGVYLSGWRAIRASNLALSKLPLLANATEEQKRLIEGQCYFFRAYNHFEIARCFGGIPYIDNYLTADEDLKKPRLNYRETTEKIVEDFDRAAELLPDDWDNTSVGASVRGSNVGRITKGAALAYKARALLYAASPLMVHESGGGYEFDQDLLRKSAEAAAEVIKLAGNGVYELTPFSNYQDMFAKNNGDYPWTKETIFARTGNGKGSGRLTNYLGRNMGISRLGGNAVTETPTQNLVDAFETVNGLPIDDPASGYNMLKPWDNRDPRFRAGIYVDGDVMTKKNPNNNRLQTYMGGQDYLSTSELRTPYLCHKYQPLGVNNKDQEWNNFFFVTPLMRLAEVYLNYAEAVNEISGPFGTAGGLSLTAMEAVNLVRERANMPDVNSKFTTSKENFRERIRNERTVEFFAEGHRWFDIRRWHIAHLDENRIMYSVEFDQGHTFFNKIRIGYKNFEERHYWLPFLKAQTQLYPEFPQNPGW